jgi:hypothetical protein
MSIYTIVIDVPEDIASDELHEALESIGSNIEVYPGRLAGEESCDS